MSKASSWKQHLHNDFETKKNARLWHQKLLNSVLRKQHISFPLFRLKEAIKSCTTTQPCNNEACPKCRRTFRKSLIKASEKLKLHEGVWTHITVIPNNLCFKQSELIKADLPKIIKRLNKSISRSDLSDAIIIGGIDISLNSFDNALEGWQLHLHFLINRPLTDALKKSIKAAFQCKRTVNVSRPYCFQTVEVRVQNNFEAAFIKVLTYSYKNKFFRRSVYHLPPEAEADKPKSKVAQRSLSPADELNLSQWLSRFNTGQRLFLRNIKRQRSTLHSLNLKIMGTLIKRSLSPQKNKRTPKDCNEEACDNFNSSA